MSQVAQEVMQAYMDAPHRPLGFSASECKGSTVLMYRNRRSSVFASATGRPSMAPLYGSSMPKDPRPVRSVVFQNECVKTVTTYLSRHKVQHALSRQNGPTQRDFQTLFRFLADQLLGPAFPWSQRKFEDDCIAILRDLQYPAFDSVGRTMLSAPGSSTHWPSVLAMLSWMVELCSVRLPFVNRLTNPRDRRCGMTWKLFRIHCYVPRMSCLLITPKRKIGYYGSFLPVHTWTGLRTSSTTWVRPNGIWRRYLVRRFPCCVV